MKAAYLVSVEKPLQARLWPTLSFSSYPKWRRCFKTRDIYIESTDGNQVDVAV